jgi:hypothetical protein
MEGPENNGVYSRVVVASFQAAMQKRKEFHNAL